jgi:nicotinamide phosphoribosyltransferase
MGDLKTSNNFRPKIGEVIMNENYLFDTDSYKASHWLQYPEKTTSMFSYIESRGSDEGYKATVFFGLQYFLKAYLTYRVSAQDVEDAKVFYAAHGEPFNYDGWMYIAKDLEGKLPIRIRAVPEGTIVPTHNILVSIESTDPKVFWVVSWLETMMLRYVWYGTTVATRSRKIKQIILEALRKSSDDPETEINFKLHDFGSRGVSSQESAMLGGAAHLINFMGSDTVVGVRCANKYYNHSMAGFSIPAAEHSSIISWGKDHELDAYRNMLKRFAKKDAMVAIVSDSYDLYNAITNLWGTELKDEVIKSKATVIIRPDSGDPATVVLQSLRLLEEKFGSVPNSKGYKVLNNVRVIQGDGINEKSIQEILDTVIQAGFSITNIAFGMGGQLLQALNRDTLKFAMKASSITVNGVVRSVSKDPITDPGKKSKAGRLDLVRRDGAFETIEIDREDQASHDNFSEMETVYQNGKVLIDDTFDNIRSRAVGESV